MLDRRLQEATNAVRVALADSTPPVEGLESAPRHLTRGPWWKPALVVAVAFIAVLVVGGASLVWRGGGAGVVDEPLPPAASVIPEPSQVPQEATTAPTSTAVTEPPATSPGQPAEKFALSVEVSFATEAVYLYDVAMTPGWVWAVTDGGLHRIDPETGSMDTTIDLARPLARTNRANIEVGDGALWITHGTALSRVDPDTAAVTGTIVDLEWAWSHQTRPLAVGYGGVWMAGAERLVRIDEDDLEVTTELPLASTPSGLAVGADAVWALVGQNVLRIDPATLDTVATIPLQASVFHPSIGTPLTFGQDAVWVSVGGGVSRLDPTTNQVSVVFHDADCCGAAAVGFAADSIIAYGLDEKDIVIVDPNTGELEPIFTTPMAVFAIEGDSNGFWAADSRSGMLYRFDALTKQP